MATMKPARKILAVVGLVAATVGTGVTVSASSSVPPTPAGEDEVATATTTTLAPVAPPTTETPDTNAPDTNAPDTNAPSPTTNPGDVVETAPSTQASDVTGSTEPGSTSVPSTQPNGSQGDETEPSVDDGVNDDGGDAASTTVPPTTAEVAEIEEAAVQTEADVQKGAISGTVTDEGGNPVAGVRVSIYAGFDEDEIETMTAADGTYELVGVERGIHAVSFEATSGLFLDAAVQATVVAGELTTGVDAVLVRADSAVSGTVTDTAGNPLSGIDVLVCVAGREWEYVEDGSVCRSVETSSDGSYQAGKLSAGRYTVAIGQFAPYVAEFYSGSSTLAGATIVEVAAGENVTGINASLTKRGTVSGTVTDIAGAGLDDFRVDLYDDEDRGVDSTYTARDGTYMFDDLEPGQYRVGFRDGYYDGGNQSGYANQFYDGVGTLDEATWLTVDDEVALTGINAVLTEGGTVSGTVVGDDGLPARGIPVEVCVKRSCQYSYTHADGTYKVVGVTPGEATVQFVADYEIDWTVEAYVPEYYDDASSETSATLVTVVAGEEISGIDAELGLRGRISGKVTDTDGNPLYDIAVEIHQGGSYIASAYTGRDGTYQTKGLPAGDDYTVEFTDFDDDYWRFPGYTEYFDDAKTEEEATEVEVKDGVVTKGIDAEIPRDSGARGAISGKTTDERGVPLRNIRVRACSTPTVCFKTVTWIDGTYVLDSLPAGTYTVDFSDFSDVMLPEYFDDAATRSDATPVPVLAGKTTGGLDAVLSPPDDPKRVPLDTSTLPLAQAPDGVRPTFGRLSPGAIAVLRLADVRFGDFDGDGTTDVFMSVGGSWRYWSSELGEWLTIRSSGLDVEVLRFGDFDNDGVTDVFQADGEMWRYWSSRSSEWVELAASDLLVDELRFGDFDGDEVTDVFVAQGGTWRYWSGKGLKWVDIADSELSVDELELGDFDGDDVTDIFTAREGEWRFWSTVSSEWVSVTESDLELSELRFVDIDGDNSTDVFTADGGQWRYWSTGKAEWIDITLSELGVNDVEFGDFDGDDQADVFVSDGDGWRYWSTRTGEWTSLLDANVTLS